MVRAEVIADPRGQLLRGQNAARFGYCSLAMYPLRLDVVQPGALGRQKARDNLNTTLILAPTTKRLSVVLSYPVTYLSADMPGSVVPDERKHSLAFLSQTFAYPLQIGDADMAHRP